MKQQKFNADELFVIMPVHI